MNETIKFNYSSLSKLNADCLLIILRYLNLRERAPVRLVNKCLKALCDSIYEVKLVVYERDQLKVGDLFDLSDEHSLTNSVFVSDLNQFLNSEIIQKSIKHIRTLIIKGKSRNVNKLVLLNAQFNQLKHLELHNCDLINSAIVQSVPIERLLLFSSSLILTNRIVNETNLIQIRSFSQFPFNFRYGLSKVKCNLKYLSLNADQNIKFFVYCTLYGLFDSLEHLDFITQLDDDLYSLTYLSEKCPSLKRIDLITYNHRTGIVDLSPNVDLEFTLSKLRKDLLVHLFGIEFNRGNFILLSFFCFLFRNGVINFTSKTKKFSLNFNRIISNRIYSVLTIKEFDFIQFFKLVEKINVFEDGSSYIADQQFFERFVNCKFVSFLNSNPYISFNCDHLFKLKCLKTVMFKLNRAVDTITLARSLKKFKDLNLDYVLIDLNQKLKIEQIDLNNLVQFIFGQIRLVYSTNESIGTNEHFICKIELLKAADLCITFSGDSIKIWN